jgi:hypothetical protein
MYVLEIKIQDYVFQHKWVKPHAMRHYIRQIVVNCTFEHYISNLGIQ